MIKLLGLVLMTEEEYSRLEYNEMYYDLYWKQLALSINWEEKYNKVYALLKKQKEKVVEDDKKYNE